MPDRLLDAARRFWRAGEPVHPDAVAPQQVIEGRMNRPEEGAALAFAILLGEPIGAAVEIPVLPAIIVRHPLHELPVDHGKPFDQTAASDTTPISSAGSIPPFFHNSFTPRCTTPSSS